MSATTALHAADELPSVSLDTYNLEMRDNEGGFVGDRASNRAFRSILEDWRARLRKTDPDGEDPLGEESSASYSKRKLDALLRDGDPEAAGLVLGAIEEFAQELAAVTRRFLRTRGWKETQRIAVGGGLRESRLGELAIGRASVILRAGGLDVPLRPIRHHPDEAGLIGAAHLMPKWMFAGHDSLLAVDIGGSNIRAGVVQLNMRAAEDLSKAEVWKSELWRHRAPDKEQPTRDEAMQRLARMLADLIAQAKKTGLKLSPFIGVGCPGLLEDDGSISRGGQNLPGGNWESKRFNLPECLAQAVPEIAGETPLVVMHNDAVVQGLSEIPFMQDVDRWGILTIGTGLGNARFTNRRKDEAD
jgi:hypothetical protein